MRKRLFGYRDAGPVFIWAFVGLQAVSLLYALTASDNLFVSSLFSNAALAAVYIVYTRAAGIDPVRGARLNGGFRWWFLLLACVLTYLLQYASYGSMTLFDGWLRAGGYTSQNPLSNVTFTEYGAGGLVGYLLLVGLVTGFCEELVFRGALLAALRARLGDGRAVLVSALAFMLFHGSPDQTIFQFLFGLLLGYVTVRTASVVPAMVMHAFNNMFSIAATAGGAADRIFPLPHATGPLIAVAILGLALALTLLPLLVDLATGRRPFKAPPRRKNPTPAAPEAVPASAPLRLETGTRLTAGAAGHNPDAAAAEEEPAILDPAPNPSADKLSTVLLAGGMLVCLGIWIANLVTGIVG